MKLSEPTFMPPATRSVPGSAFKAFPISGWCSDASDASNASDFPGDAGQSELSDYSDSSEWLGPPSDTSAPSKKRSQKHDT